MLLGRSKSEDKLSNKETIQETQATMTERDALQVLELTAKWLIEECPFHLVPKPVIQMVASKQEFFRVARNCGCRRFGNMGEFKCMECQENKMLSKIYTNEEVNSMLDVLNELGTVKGTHARDRYWRNMMEKLGEDKLKENFFSRKKMILFPDGSVGLHGVSW